MKKFKKIGNIVLSIIAGILLVFSLIVLIIGIKANREGKMPNVFGYTYSVVSSSSMVPTYEVGDIIITKNINYDDVEVEDIIVFYSPTLDKFVVHRVIDINEDGSFITQGDNNPSPDNEYVYEENYIGVVKAKIPKIGTLVLENRNILFIIVISIFAFVIIVEIVNIIKNINEDRRQKLEKYLEEKYGKISEEDN